jgi:hypothetical protein
MTSSFEKPLLKLNLKRYRYLGETPTPQLDLILAALTKNNFDQAFSLAQLYGDPNLYSWILTEAFRSPSLHKETFLKSLSYMADGEGLKQAKAHAKRRGDMELLSEIRQFENSSSSSS